MKMRNLSRDSSSRKRIGLLRSESGSSRMPERGVALVTVLLLLTMMGALGVGLVLSLGADMMINGYYRNYRGAFYAADSGLNIARAQLASQTVAAVPTTAQAFFPAPPIANP